MTNRPVIIYPALQQPILTPTQRPETVTESRWHQPFVDPQRNFAAKIARGFAIAIIASGLAPIDPKVLTLPERVDESKWHQPWSEPVRVKPALRTAIQQSFVIDAAIQPQEPTRVDKWYIPLSDPVRRRPPPLLTAQHPYESIDPKVLTLPERVDESKWHQPWSEPVRLRPALGAGLQQFLAIDPFILTQKERVDESKWHQPWSEPVRFKATLRPANQEYYFAPATVPGTGPATDAVPVHDIQPPQAIKRIQYQAKGEAVFFAPPADGWGGPWSEPSRFKPFLRSAQQEDYFSPLVVTELVTLDKWYRLLETPVRTRQLLTAQQQAATIDPTALTFPETTTVDRYWQPFSERLYGKRGLAAQHQQFFTIDADFEGPVTTDKWFAYLSEPVRFKATLGVQRQQFLAFDPDPTPPAGEDAWLIPWSEPLRFKKTIPAAQQEYEFVNDYKGLTQPERVDESKWHFAWSEPVRQKPGLLAALQQFFTVDPRALTQAENVPEAAWHYPWSEPVRLKPALRPGQQQFFAFEPDPTPPAGEDSWHQPWSEPVRFKPSLRALQQAFLGETDITPPSGEDAWHVPWSEPVRLNVLKTAQQQAFTVDPFALTRPETTTVDRYWQPFSEPVRFKKPVAWQQGAAETLGAPQETVTVDKWFRPLEDPVRLKRRAAEFQAFTIDPKVLTLAEFVSEDRWHQPWSEPVRRRAKVAEYPVAYPFDTDATPPAGEDSWHQGWSEPVRLRRAQNQMSDAWTPLTVETINPDKWFRPLSEPTRRVARAAYFQDLAIDPKVLTLAENITLDKWFEPWSERLYPKKGLAAHEQQFFTQDTKAENAYVDVPYDRWGFAWSEPVRPRLLLAGQRQYEARDSEPIAQSRLYWFAPFNEPVRVRPALRAALQREFTTSPFSLLDHETITLDKWVYRWEEPVRVKRRVPQQMDAVWHITIGISTIDKWYAPWREPVWPKRGLAARYQQFFTISPSGMLVGETTLLSKWYAPWREPVRKKPGLVPALQPSRGNDFTPPPFVPTFPVYIPMEDTIIIDLNPCCEDDC